MIKAGGGVILKPMHLSKAFVLLHSNRETNKENLTKWFKKKTFSKLDVYINHCRKEEKKSPENRQVFITFESSAKVLAPVHTIIFVLI